MASKIGQKTYNYALIVPGNKAKEVEGLLAVHEAWMRETHSLKDDNKLQLIDFHWSKSEELNNPIDQNAGTTGNILYALTEVYSGEDWPDKHKELAMQWDSFQAVAGAILEYGKVMLVEGTIIHAME